MPQRVYHYNKEKDISVELEVQQMNLANDLDGVEIDLVNIQEKIEQLNYEIRSIVEDNYRSKFIGLNFRLGPLYLEIEKYHIYKREKLRKKKQLLRLMSKIEEQFNREGY